MTEDAPKYEPKVLDFPTPVTRLWILNDVAVTSSFRKPNKWRRFWYWALLGWRWTDIDEEGK